ncbi:fumarylacetoacetase [Ideonella azotifigens]|uniref:fumarylacetoacetase n=1 Tax=Ideonella azotifigens TaxID=513160 RepID=A0ABP3UW41_9BURK|nr:fumarylacetoacetase [Ideonella azotifigens]MCD2341893.1 fumarylacetoacetase [Ideonella azotifigens]
MTLNATHDARLRSWVDAANLPGTDFPIQNLPHGVFRRAGSAEAFRGGVAIGDQILDMRQALAAEVFPAGLRAAAEAAAQPTLNALMALGPAAWSALRAGLSAVLREGAPEAGRLAGCLVPQAQAEHAVPAAIGDYTDFFTSRAHMLNMGRMFQPTQPALPQFSWLPIGYHGRSSSIEVSGAGLPRPWGQYRRPGQAEPVFAPTCKLDYELELGAYVGPGNERGQPVPLAEAESHLFGVCLLNDWSARDVQGWESLPLGPFLAKNFLTTVSPWIVTLEALAPFRCPLAREAGDPPGGPNLAEGGGASRSGLDLTLEVWLATAASQGQAFRISHSSSRHAHWGLAQMLAHHTENGCNLRPGDLLGTGTQSGPRQGEQGCLMELGHNGQRPVALGNGETRTTLEDGDTVILRAWGVREGFARIGFGDCRGTVLPARER